MSGHQEIITAIIKQSFLLDDNTKQRDQINECHIAPTEAHSKINTKSLG